MLPWLALYCLLSQLAGAYMSHGWRVWTVDRFNAPKVLTAPFWMVTMVAGLVLVAVSLAVQDGSEQLGAWWQARADKRAERGKRLEKHAGGVKG